MNSVWGIQCSPGSEITPQCVWGGLGSRSRCCRQQVLLAWLRGGCSSPTQAGVLPHPSSGGFWPDQGGSEELCLSTTERVMRRVGML